ncbi:hypothetical protein BGX27_000309, partial [Mortierella sp. AM989]
MQAPSHHDLPGHSGARSAGPSTNSSSLLSNNNHHHHQSNNHSVNVDENDSANGIAYRSQHASQPTNKQQQQQQQQQTPRPSGSRTGQNRNSLNGHTQGTSSEKAASTALGMGDGIVNQSMKEDLESWISALNLPPDTPLNVIGYFGQCRDLSMFERIYPAGKSDQEGIYDDDFMPVYHDESRDFFESDSDLEQQQQNGHCSGWAMGFSDKETTGDIHMYIDRSKNTLMLQHAYLYDTQDMLSVCLESSDAVTKDRASLMKWMHDQEFESHRALLFLFLVSQVVVHTSPDMNIDPKIISVLLALSTVKRQIMQELDRFMTICWDRIGVQAPDHHRQNSEQSGGGGSSNGGGGGGQFGRGTNSMASVFTPGKCVPVLVFVVERVPVMAPWHDSGANENQIVEQLKQQVLKKSIDALQTRLRYIFRASKLIQSIDPPAGAFDARQLFVLPSPSNTPFVYVIPYFTGQLDLPQRTLVSNYTSGDGVLDPAEEVLRQKMKFGSNNNSNLGGGSKKHGYKPNAKSPLSRGQREKKWEARSSSFNNTTTTLDLPTLREIYDSVVQVRDQPLDRAASGGRNPRMDDAARGEGLSPVLSLGSLYMDYTGPLLRQFVDGWLKNVTSSGGYGSVIGKRNGGNVEIPSLQQWMAGCLGVCESLGINSLATPEFNKYHDQSTIIGDGNAALTDQERLSTDDHGISNKLSKMNIESGTGGGGGGGNGSGNGGSSRRSGNGKKYSQRCANMVQKKIQDYILTDDVMEEL